MDSKWKQLSGTGLERSEVKASEGRSSGIDVNLNLEDLPKETCIGLLKLYSRLMIALDGFWYISLKERTSNDEALECDKWVWDKVMKYMVDDVVRVIGVQGRDVADFMKVLQARPMHFTHEERMEAVTRNDAVLTVTQCPTLVALEKEGLGRDATHCKSACSTMRVKHAKLFNPAMEVICLKMPPRRSKEDISCQWEYKIG